MLILLHSTFNILPLFSSFLKGVSLTTENVVFSCISRSGYFPKNALMVLLNTVSLSKLHISDIELTTLPPSHSAHTSILQSAFIQER
jgi:hypothetical protein